MDLAVEGLNPIWARFSLDLHHVHIPTHSVQGTEGAVIEHDESLAVKT